MIMEALHSGQTAIGSERPQIDPVADFTREIKELDSGDRILLGGPGLSSFSSLLETTLTNVLLAACCWLPAPESVISFKIVP